MHSQPNIFDHSSQISGSLDHFLSIIYNSSPHDSLGDAHKSLQQYAVEDVPDNIKSQSYTCGPTTRLELATPLPYRPSHRVQNSPNASSNAMVQAIRPSPTKPSFPILNSSGTSEPLPSLPPNASTEERTAWVRRKNTLSARKNRKLRAMRAQQVEEQVTQLRLEREIWKTRADTLSGLLRSHGIPCPEWGD